MVDRDALLAAFNDYADAMLSPYEIGDALHRLTDHAVAVLHVDGAGVSLAEGDGLVFVAATDADIATIEAAQEAGSEGPCHTAYLSGERVAVDDLALTDRWPTFSAVAIERGCRAAAGIPMPSHHRRIGALNLYRHDPHPWSTAELDIGQMLSNMASGYVLGQTELTASRTLAEQLQAALDSRIVIEQAKGVIASQRRISTDDAFDVIRQQARSTNTKLHEVCRDVVETSTGPA